MATTRSLSISKRRNKSINSSTSVEETNPLITYASCLSQQHAADGNLETSFTNVTEPGIKANPTPEVSNPTVLAEEPKNQRHVTFSSGEPEGEEQSRQGHYGTIRSRPRSQTDGFLSRSSDRKSDRHEDAALYVREGEDSDEFYVFPKKKQSRYAYKILLNPVYRVCHLCVCILLLLLALVEAPSLSTFADFSEKTLITITWVHALVEIILLSLIALDLAFKFLWIKYHFFYKRTMLILFFLVVMCAEAIAVMVKQDSHFRITRAFRPIFLIDTHLMREVRRILRHILWCWAPILDVLILLTLSIVVFSYMGFLIFAKMDTTYFSSFSQSLVSLFITMTTSNYPDVFLEAYIRQPFSSIFFVIYIIITVYLISNVLLAVVYSSFVQLDKRKFKKTFLHKRRVLERVYKHLKSTDGEFGITFRHFYLFVKRYRPNFSKDPEQVICLFEALRKVSQPLQKSISLKKFYHFYDYCNFKWKKVPVTADGKIMACFKSRPFSTPATWRHMGAIMDWLDIFINTVLITNIVFLVVYTLFGSDNDAENQYFRLNRVVAISLVFVSIYVLEICFRAFAYGLFNYFRKPRNIIDGLVVLTSFVLLVVEASNPAYAFLAVFRSVKFFRLLQLTERYRDSIDALKLISHRLLSISILLVIIYYFFAIIGMEFFKNALDENCCNGSWYGVGELYSGNNRNFTPNVYYLLNFDNILRSYVTLFVLMVVNNWFIIMEGFATTSNYSWLVRLYFMTFYIVTMVGIQVVMSLIVEVFVLSLKWRELSKNQGSESMRREEAILHIDSKKRELYIRIVNESDSKKESGIEADNENQHDSENGLGGNENTTGSESEHGSENSETETGSESEHGSENSETESDTKESYVGRRSRTKDDVALLMYEDKLKKWGEEISNDDDTSWWKPLKDFIKKGKNVIPKCIAERLHLTTVTETESNA